MKFIHRAYIHHPVYTVISMTILLLLGSLSIGYLVETLPVIKSFDAYFYTHINGLPHNKTTDTLLYPFDLWFLPWKIFFFPGFFYFFFTPFLIYLFFKDRSKFITAVVALVFGIEMVALLLAFDWHFLFRQRPFLFLDNVHLSDSAKKTLVKWPSFPSGHTRDTTMFATIFAYFLPETKYLMLAFSVFIAFTRVYTGEHYPTDVLAGLLFGFLSGVIALLITFEFKKIIFKLFKKHLKTHHP